MAISAIKTHQELDRRLDIIARKSLDNIAELVAMVWKTFIQTRFYDRYEPAVYQRTGQLLESVVTTDVHKTDGGYVVWIYMDPDGVKYESGGEHYPEEKVIATWKLAAENLHGFDTQIEGEPEGRYMTELLKFFRQGTLAQEFLSILKDMGVNAKYAYWNS